MMYVIGDKNFSHEDVIYEKVKKGIYSLCF